MSFTRLKSGAAKHRRGTSKSRAAGSRKSFKGDNGRVAERDNLFTPSTGNVYEDIGFPPHEAHRLLLQSQLAVAIEQFIRRRNLTQARAAKIFGVTQPRISDLMRGRLDKFSIDMLITMLSRAGMEVRIAVTAPKAA
jgi:predicted XRE-type DNA-binding protein